MQFRSTGTRLATAITAVLAVTALGAGTLATAPAAFAATPGAVRAADDQPAALPSFPEDSELGGTGATGFFMYSFPGDRTREVHWTPYAGGAATQLQLPEGGGLARSGTDVVAIGDDGFTSEMRSLTLRNMADPSAPGVDIDLRALDANFVAVVSPTSVLAQVTKADGTAELHVVTKDGTTTTTRKISGLPADATHFHTSAPVKGGVAFVGYEQGPADFRNGGRAVIDVAAGTVSETYSAVEGGYGFRGLSFSDSHVAWFGHDIDLGYIITSVDRATREVKRTALGDDEEWHHQLVGGWLVYGNAWQRLKAVSLTTGETRVLLDSGSRVWAAADGSAVVQGKRAADGAGLFRIAAAADGTPTVTKVAEEGEPLGVKFRDVHFPDVANLDQTGGTVTLGWTLSRPNVRLDVALIHDATGKEFRTRVAAPASGSRFDFTWDGTIDGVDAPNGRYSVTAHATPLDGVGSSVTQDAAMLLARTPNPHDYTSNGSTDVLARDAAGVLWRDDLRDRPVGGQVKPAQRTKIGAGWNTYKQIEAVGDLNGDKVGDLLGLDSAGVLWHYLGKGDGTFTTRARVGAGWGVYNQLTGGSDLNGDGRADLVATDTTGVLWFYKGTGSATAPFAPRVKVGAGWGAYNQITAVGNIVGSAAGDLVARDKDGILWLYQGTGSATAPFAPRVKVGAGWGAFSQLVGAGDLDNDGRPDLIAYGAGGTSVYRSTGSATAPFSRQATPLYAGEGTKFNNIA
ncbi:FG-GAP-like repeat-containing protein [Streptomyces sp. NPDC058579]|uniref:FG-GAP-like repeat-containing protein n=1 Tax=Streptomyces sp. NPDC058579 TaxID=3346548 RepID=UPI003665D197